ncbi:MAG: MotA/TolQ/ExbB proton channel family protein, partial [Bdellovibrionales bacterium]|nr:MotA/TolQ/ExbB proton channel family protein [Bdellovibrionales bacterium]
MMIVNGIASFIQSGGIFMWIILIIWGVGIAISLERFVKLFF